MSGVGVAAQVLGQTQDHRHRVLVAAAKNIKNWFVKVRKIKAIYHTLNLLNLDVTQKCLIAECWCAVSDLEKIQLALRRGTVSGPSASLELGFCPLGGGHLIVLNADSSEGRQGHDGGTSSALAIRASSYIHEKYLPCIGLSAS